MIDESDEIMEIHKAFSKTSHFHGEPRSGRALCCHAALLDEWQMFWIVLSRTKPYNFLGSKFCDLHRCRFYLVEGLSKSRHMLACSRISTSKREEIYGTIPYCI